MPVISTLNKPTERGRAMISNQDRSRPERFFPIDNRNYSCYNKKVLCEVAALIKRCVSSFMSVGRFWLARRLKLKLAREKR